MILFKLAQQSGACYAVRVMCCVAEFIFGLCFFLFLIIPIIFFHNDG